MSRERGRIIKWEEVTSMPEKKKKKPAEKKREEY
jgi:hypothetical protein